MMEQPSILDTLMGKIDNISEQLNALSKEDRRRLGEELLNAVEDALSSILDVGRLPEPDTVEDISNRIMGIADGMDDLDDRVEYLERVSIKMSQVIRQMADHVLDMEF